MPTNLEFRGRWLNVYGNLILIAILTGFTAGIYVPWGYARWQRITTENTYFEDQQLEFDGSGAEVFVQFITIGFYTLITLGLYIILGFSATRMLRWQYAHTLMPNGQRMDYQGKTVDIFWEWLLLVFFTPLTLGIYYYWGRNRLRRQVLTNVSLDDQQIQFGSTGGDYLLAVLSNWVMTVIAVGVYAALGFFLRRQLLASDLLPAQLGSVGGDFPLMNLVNLLLVVVALGIYALPGLALLGMATVRLRAWEVNRTLPPTPVRSRTPMPVISTPVSALAGAPAPEPPATDSLADSVADERELLYADDALPRSRDSGYDEDSLPRQQSGRQARQEKDEYYDFADYSAQTGQEPGVNSGDERTDWSSEQWARPQANSLTDEAETEPPPARRVDDEA